MSRRSATADSSDAWQDPGLPGREAAPPLPPAAPLYWCEYCQSAPLAAALGQNKKKKKKEGERSQKPNFLLSWGHVFCCESTSLCLRRCFSMHRCMRELPTPFQIYHLWCSELWHFHKTLGDGELFPWYSSHTAFVCPRCLWKLKEERSNTF